MPPPVQQTSILSADVVARTAGGLPSEQQPRRQNNNASALRGAVQSATQAAAGLPSLLHPVSNLPAPSHLAQQQQQQQQQGRQSPAARRPGFRPGLPPLSEEHPPSRAETGPEDDDRWGIQTHSASVQHRQLRAMAVVFYLSAVFDVQAV